MNTGFIGIGSMGGMLVRAFLRSGALAPADVYVANRSPQKLASLSAEFPGIHAGASRELAAHCDLIFLCVKGNETPAILAQVESELYPGQLLVTIASVLSLRALEDRVPCRVAKLVPSITQEIGAGVALLMYGSRITPGDRVLLEGMLGKISHPIVIAESQARPAISLTSGAPALIAYLLRSMAEEAARNNPSISPELAASMVQETAVATLRLMQEKQMSVEELVRRVAVPGGMTALSIEILQRHLPQAWQTIFRETAEREAKERAALSL